MTTWPRAQVRYVTQFLYGDSLSADARVPGDVQVFGSNGVVGTHAKPNTSGPVIVIGRKGSFGKVNFSHEPVFAIDTTYFIDATATSQDLRWLAYALSTLGLDQLSQDVGVPGLSRESAYREKVPLPPREEQRKIAAYLDVEVARIEALVAAKSHLHQLLLERRAAMSNEVLASAVTGERIPFGYAVDEVDERLGGNEPPELLSVSIHHGVVPRSELTDRVPRAEEMSAYKLCRPGDLALNRLRAFQGGVGQVAVDGIVSPDYIVLRPREGFTAAYLHHLMRSAHFVSEMSRRLRGIGDAGQTQVRTPRINWSDLRLIKIPVLPLETQRDLVSTIEASATKLVKVMDALTAQIKLLHEHRHALTSAAVSGELEVA